MNQKVISMSFRREDMPSISTAVSKRFMRDTYWAVEPLSNLSVGLASFACWLASCAKRMLFSRESMKVGVRFDAGVILPSNSPSWRSCVLLNATVFR